MEEVNWGRVLMGDSLGFHIIFATLSIGIPFVMSLLELYAVRKKNEQVLHVVKLLARWTVVLAVTGVISGTIIAFQFAILWPHFIETVSPAVGIGFQLETYAFLLEAIFLAWYMMSWDKVSPMKHWLIGLPITIGAIGSAVFITCVNAFMNNPTGIVVEGTKIVSANIPEALFSTTAFFEVTHSVLAYLLCGILAVASFAAWRLWRQRKAPLQSSTPVRIIGLMSFAALAMIAATAVMGHFQTQYLAQSEPRKFAALETVGESYESHAPYRILGDINEEGKAEGGIVVPGLLSFLAGNSFDTPVVGLDKWDRSEWPMLVINKLFEIKLALITLLGGLIAATAFWYWRFKHLPRWLSRPFMATGIIALAIVELGWMLTELGRQPYAVVGLLTTADAFTKDNSALQLGIIFPLLFVVLFAVSFSALAIVTRKWRKEYKVDW